MIEHRSRWYGIRVQGVSCSLCSSLGKSTKQIYFLYDTCSSRLSLVYVCIKESVYFSLQIAITGEGFFRASEMSTELIISNILRIGKVNIIGDVILFLGKLCVSLSSVLFAFLMLETHRYRSAHNKISSPLFPVVVSFVYSYILSSIPINEE